MKIDVTELDIENGKCGVAFSCPVALAVRRATGITRVYVGSRHLEIGDRRMAIPIPVRRFITCFDAEIPVGPFSFELEGI